MGKSHAKGTKREFISERNNAINSLKLLTSTLESKNPSLEAMQESIEFINKRNVYIDVSAYLGQDFQDYCYYKGIDSYINHNPKSSILLQRSIYLLPIDEKLAKGKAFSEIMQDIRKVSRTFHLSQEVKYSSSDKTRMLILLHSAIEAITEK